MAEIKVKTFATIGKRKTLGERLLEEKGPARKKNQWNNADYREIVVFISTLSISTHDDAWYIDSRASMHLSHKHEWFRDFEENPPMKIYLRNNTIQEIVGRGKVMAFLKLEDKTTHAYFNNTFYAPELVKNFFSIKQVVSMGHIIEFGGSQCVIKIKARMW